MGHKVTLAVTMEIEPIDGAYGSALTDKQALFARRYVELGGSAEVAALEAGYSDGKYGYQLTRLPHVQAAIREAQERMVAEGASKGLRWMVKALDDAKLSGAVRFQCARWLAEAAGHGLAPARARLGLDGDDKPESELTLAELDARIRAGERAVAVMREAAANAQAIPGQLVVPDGALSLDADVVQVVDPEGVEGSSSEPG